MSTAAQTLRCPTVPLSSLDELWFQVSGTRCNLECSHCFISCSPHNDKFGYLSLKTVRRFLDESVEHGVREYYFTGGEPFPSVILRGTSTNPLGKSAGSAGSLLL